MGWGGPLGRSPTNALAGALNIQHLLCAVKTIVHDKHLKKQWLRRGSYWSAASGG